MKPPKVRSRRQADEYMALCLQVKGMQICVIGQSANLFSHVIGQYLIFLLALLCEQTLDIFYRVVVIIKCGF